MTNFYSSSILYFAIVVLTVCSVTFGQNKRILPKKTIHKPAYDTKSLDNSLEFLPKDYLGHDIKIIFAHFENIFKKKKSEFETTEEFIKRRIIELSDPFSKDLPANSILAFPLTSKQSSLEYDADTQSLNISIFLEGVRKGYDWEGFVSSKESIELQSQTVITDTSGGITKRGIEEYALAFDDDIGFPIENTLKHYRESIYFAIKMPLSLAKKIKSHLRVLVTCEVADPYVHIGELIANPSPDNRKYTHIFTRYLHVELKEIWIYDAISGKVYEKISETSFTDSEASLSNKAADEPLKITYFPRAVRTPEAIEKNISGTVRLNVEFLKSGKIGTITPINTLAYGLTEQAIAAARKIKFEPAKKNDIPFTVTKSVEFNFLSY